MENKKLKLYRIVNHPYLTYLHKYSEYESLLYLGGYMMLKKEQRATTEVSNIYKFHKDYSKYFFVFPEDAFNFGRKLTHTDAQNILEYEFDYDKLPKVFGLGNYNEVWYGEVLQHPENFAVESLVSLDELEGEALNLNKLTKKEKLKMLDKLQVNTINAWNYYCRIFSREELNIKKTQYMQMAFEEPELKPFLNNFDMKILKSSNITGKMFTIFTQFSGESKITDEHVIEHLKQQGLILNFSEEAEQARLEIVKDLMDKEGLSNGEYLEKAKEKVLDYRRSFPN